MSCVCSGVGTLLDVANIIRGFSWDKQRQLLTLSVCNSRDIDILTKYEAISPSWKNGDKLCEALKVVKLGGVLLFNNRMPDAQFNIVLF